MRKIIGLFAVIALIAAVSSCKSKKGDTEKSATITVKDDGSEYASDSLTEAFEDFVKIDSGEYTLTKSIYYEVSFRLKGNFSGGESSLTDEDKANLAKLKDSQLTIALVDKDGTEISGVELEPDESIETILDWAVNNFEGKKEFKFKGSGSFDVKEEELFEKVAGIKVYVKANESSSSETVSSSDETVSDDSSTEDDEEASSDDESTDEEEASSGSASSSDIDAMLDSYDEYVTQYIKFVKKAANGDMSAMQEYPSLMSKAEEFEKKIDNVKGDLSAAQLARYQRIINKMLKAAQEMN